MSARSFFEDLDQPTPKSTSLPQKKRSFFDDLDSDASETQSQPILKSFQLQETRSATQSPQLQEKGIQRSFFEDIDEPLPETPQSQDKASLFDRFGRGLSYTAQTTNAVTPRGAKILTEEAPKILEGATGGLFQAPEHAVPEEEQEGRRVVGESLRLGGETALIGGAHKFLRYLGVDPKTWYGRVGVGAGIGGGLSATKQAAYKGEVDPAEVARDAAIWGALDLGLEVINGAVMFKRAVDYIHENTGKTKEEVLSFLKDCFMSKFRGKPQAEPEVLAREAIAVADETAHEVKAAGPIAGEAERVTEEPLHDADAAPKTLDESVQSKIISETEAPEEALSLRERFEDYENRFLNQFAPLDRLADTPEVFENPGKLAELVDGAAGQTKQALEHGQFDIENLETTGPGLRQIFEPKIILAIEGKKKLDRRAFRGYLAARSSLDRAKLGQKTAVPVDEAMQYIQKHKRYEPLAEAYTKFLGQNLTNLRKSGMLTADAEKAMREMYTHYAPLHRLVEKPRRSSRRSLQPEKLPKSAKGSARTILDPLESAVKNTAATYRAIAKNREPIAKPLLRRGFVM